jgi:hypothetical protein
MNACPEMPDLLDHLEGRSDLAPHLVACEPCSTALADLRAALAAESDLVATRPLETERALTAVMNRARAHKKMGSWRVTGFFSAAAAVTLALLMPANLVPKPDAGPSQPGANFAVQSSVPNVDVDEQKARDIIGVGSTAFIHS